MKLIKTIHRKKDLNLNGKMLSREAVRGIIAKDDKILMIYSGKKNFDYKFPGGGIQKNESHNDTLIREILEETGYEIITIDESFGKVVELDIPQEKDFDVVKMISYYYYCTISDSKSDQKLDDYEHDLGFSAEWINIDKAIAVNEKLLAAGKAPRWTAREVLVLKELKSQI